MNWFKLFTEELKALFSNPVVVLTVFGGVVFYSFLYPLPYSQQTPREQTLSVVNLDKSQASYQLERMVDATPQVNVMRRDHSIEEAKQAFLAQQVSGILVIPENFYKDLMMGKSTTLAYAGDASYFLVYGTLVEGLAQAGGTLAAKTKVSRLIVNGEPLVSASQHYAATQQNLKPTFNPRMGYVDYVVPAVFVLILQQTMVIASGMMIGTQKHQRGYWSQLSGLQLIVLRTLVLVPIYYVLSMYYFGASFSMHGVNTIGRPFEILTLLLPFLLTACFIGLWLGTVTPRRELVTLVVLLSSMPLVFSAGFIWPIEAIPPPLLWLSKLFPSTPAIQGFLALNQMGADWRQIAPQWTLLWGQTVIWFIIAWYQLTKTSHSKRH